MRDEKDIIKKKGSTVQDIFKQLTGKEQSFLEHLYFNQIILNIPEKFKSNKKIVKEVIRNNSII